ncbi:MAG: hypothetical protein CSA38_03785 [Flavobacteriales bacterium]|nr:MAG: hypothetical protein CSA38_03785 [Flavobacteriales bacterium]
MLKKVSFMGLILFLGCLFFIAIFNRFQTDDYILAWMVEKFGLIGSVAETHTEWSGRYFSFTLAKLTSLTHHQYNVYPVLLPMISILLLYLGAFLLFRNYFQNSLAKSSSKALVFCALYFLLSLNIGEHLYWSAGAKIYLFPFIYLVFFLHFLTLNNRQNQWYYQLMMYILTFMIMGSNEIIAIIFCTALFFIQYSQKAYRKLLFFGIIMLCISFLAPGNLIRMSGDKSMALGEDHKNPILIFGALNAISLVKALILVPFAHLFFSQELKKLNPIKALFPLITLSMVGILSVSVFGITAPRTSDTFLIFYFISLALLLFNRKNISHYAKFSIFLILLPPIKIPPHRNFLQINYHFYTALSDIYQYKTHLQGFKDEMKARENQLENSKSEDILLEKINNTPQTLYFEEIPGENNRSYINQQLERFYHKKSVYTK